MTPGDSGPMRCFLSTHGIFRAQLSTPWLPRVTWTKPRARFSDLDQNHYDFIAIRLSRLQRLEQARATWSQLAPARASRFAFSYQWSTRLYAHGRPERHARPALSSSTR